MKVDIFKTFLLILFVGLLYITYVASNNGRYSTENSIIIDTRTGDVYSLEGEKINTTPIP